MAKKTTRSTATADTATPTKPRARAKSSTPRSQKATASDKTVDTAALASTTLSVIIQREPTDDEVRERAYHRYLERRGAQGSEFDDWLEARRDLLEGR